MLRLGHVLGVGVGGEGLEEELRAVPGSGIHCNPLGMWGTSPGETLSVCSIPVT